MISFVWQPGFKRSYKKRILINPALKQKFAEAVTLFSINPYDPKLKTHKLSGKLKEYWAFTVDYDTRIVFKFISEHEILLIDIGSHDEVY
jgi:addiction module RelE/StbE family toxin